MKRYEVPTGSRRPMRFCMALVGLAAVCAGCHRAYYREQADRDAYALIAEKACDAGAALTDYGIEPDPRSRMFDPFDPDHPPMPPDDVTSHRLMHVIDGKRGYPHWHKDGDTDCVENPWWYESLPLDDEGVLVLDARRAMQLALLNSRDYQQQLETLYLSALDVSIERFQFDCQYFGGYAIDHDVRGRLGSGRGEADRHSSRLTDSLFSASGPGGQDLGVEKMFTTGSQMVIGLANSLIWEFSGPNRFAANSVLDFSLVQPLLRGAGRDRVMETLTIAERTLLANVRQMERFQRGFYLEIMTGVSAGQGPRRRGGVFGAGLQGFTGLGGGFGGLGGGGGAFTGGGGATGAGQAGGFMGLLQSQQEIRNLEDNLNALRSNYFRLLVTLQEQLTTIPENSESIVRERLQVAQSRQAMLDAESRLLNAKNAYENALDQFKITLGLPPHLCVEIRDPWLDRVNLVDPQIRPIQAQIATLQQQVGDIILDILPQQGQTRLIWSPEVAASLRQLRQRLDGVDEIRRQLMDGDDAQIHRVRADGIKLGRYFQKRLTAAIDRAASDETARAELARDAELLKNLLRRIESDEQWMAGLEGFNRLRDAIDDVQRFRQQLAAGGVVDVDWMRIDTNPQTRDLHRRHRDAVQAMNQATGATRRDAAVAIDRQLQQEMQPLADRYGRIVKDSPWLLELDRWRTAPEEIETEAAEETLVAISRLKRLFAQVVDTLLDAPVKFNTLPANMHAHQQKIDALLADGPSLSPDALIRRFRSDISPVIPQELVDLANDVLELSLVQARDRAETVSLIEVDLHPLAALDIARVNRRDWMNARAALVDSWRAIAFLADALESQVDIVFDGDIGYGSAVPGGRDLASGSLHTGLQIDTPLNRFRERNEYRQVLIEYQQARRNYYAFEDQVSSGLRATVRTLQLNQRNFEIRRNAVRVADLQIELNEDIRRIQEANRQPSGPTAARDTVSALTALLTAQNDFLSVWVTYEVLRRTLDFNLGTMQLDSEGMWIDPGPIGPEQGYPGVGGDEPCWPGKLVVPDAPWIEISDGCDPAPIEEVPAIVGPPAPEPALNAPES